ncbi:hypothetical protein A2U01_0094070, partial [Trifolium medium]|nr:hypothetical protein [Trifolium medium]
MANHWIGENVGKEGFRVGFENSDTDDGVFCVVGEDKVNLLKFAYVLAMINLRRKICGIYE